MGRGGSIRSSRPELREVGHVDDADDTVGRVGEELAAVAGDPEQGEQAGGEFGGVNCLQVGGLDDVDVAFGGAGYDVGAVGGEDGRGGGLPGFSGGEGRVSERSGRQAVSGGDGLGDVDQEGRGFEEGDDEEEVVVGVELGGVDWGFKFGRADSRLVGEIPEEGTAVLRRREEVATAARPTEVSQWVERGSGMICHMMKGEKGGGDEKESWPAYLRLCICFQCPLSFIATPIVSMSLETSVS